MNVIRCRYKNVLHSTMNARPVRDPTQGVLNMAQVLVWVFVFIGSLHTRLPSPLHPCSALIAGRPVWSMLLTWLTHIWSCLNPFSGFHNLLIMVRHHGVPRCGGISGRRGSVQSPRQNITPLATTSLTSVHGHPIPHNSVQTTG